MSRFSHATKKSVKSEPNSYYPSTKSFDEAPKRSLSPSAVMKTPKQEQIYGVLSNGVTSGEVLSSEEEICSLEVGLPICPFSIGASLADHLPVKKKSRLCEWMETFHSIDFLDPPLPTHASSLMKPPQTEQILPNLSGGEVYGGEVYGSGEFYVPFPPPRPSVMMKIFPREQILQTLSGGEAYGGEVYGAGELYVPFTPPQPSAVMKIFSKEQILPDLSSCVLGGVFATPMMKSPSKIIYLDDLDVVVAAVKTGKGFRCSLPKNFT